MTVRSTRRTDRVVLWSLTAVLLAVAVFPLLSLYGKAVVRLLTEESFRVPAINGALFWRSILLNIESAALCSAFGVVAALFVWRIPPAHGRRIFYLLLLCALIPPFIHVHAWIRAVDLLNGLVLQATGIVRNFTGTGAVVWTTALSYLPYTAALFYLGLKSIPAEVLELVRMEGHPLRTFLRVILPFAMNHLLIGFLFVFMINVNDYAIASVFGVSVYALELFALFSAGGDLHAIALTALPLMVLAAGLLFLMAYLAKDRGFRENFTHGANPFRRAAWMNVPAGAGSLVLALFVGIPVIAMMAEGRKAEGFLAILGDSTGQIGYSYAISLLAALLAVFPATGYAYFRTRCGGRRTTTLLLAAPFLIPSAILGLSLIATWNKGALSVLYGSAGMPAIGLAIRFGIIAILYMSFRFERIDRDLTDAALLECRSAKSFVRVILPMIRRDIAACLLMIFALSMGEYGIVLLITPPGHQMVTIKIYNYIHYGSSEIVFALNLVLLLGVLAAGASLLWIVQHREDVPTEDASTDGAPEGAGKGDRSDV
jgi:iron(III) transport system permease protein